MGLRAIWPAIASNTPTGACTSCAKDGSPYFVLKAANGEIIGKSEMYSSVAAMEKGIASVVTNAAEAEIVDTTAA